MAGIETMVCRQFGVTFAEIRSVRRYAGVVDARHAAMVLCREHTKASYPELGRYFAVHHTSVMNAVGRTAAREVARPTFGVAMDTMREALDAWRFPAGGLESGDIGSPRGAA
ncbi:MAG: helix-turn-helix domain-containing protein [Myxococcota bacterium]